MAYIGQSPINGFHAKQSLTGDGSTVTFTLDQTVATETGILVSVGGVLQEPSVAYDLTVGGTKITFSEAPSSTDTVYIHYLGKAIVQNVQDLNGAEFVLDANGNTSFTADTDDEIDIKVGGTDISTIKSTGYHNLDSIKYVAGTGDDLQLYHDGTNSYLTNSTGALKVATETSGIAITIGHTTSEVTIADNATVTGNLTVTGTLTQTGAQTFDGGIDVDNFNINGTTLALSSGDMLVDVAGDIILDADGGNITFKDAGTAIGDFSNSSSDFVITSSVQDKDIIFKGDDGGSAITALTLDMSGAGAATFNSTVTASGFVGNVTGNASGTALTVTQAAQTAITSVGTLTALTVDDVAVNGKVITMTGSSSDTATLTAGTNGTLDIVTTDAGGAAANIQITADGTAELAGTTVTLDSAGGITLDADGGTITFADAGSSLGTITSSGYSGTAAVATTVTVTDNESTDENNVLTFVAGADADGGNVGLESDGNLNYNPSSGTLNVPNISVTGTQTIVNSVTMNASNAVIFEGATADAHETTLSTIDATGDRTINLPNVSGTLPVLAAASATQITSTPEELNKLDGATVTVGEINLIDGGATVGTTAFADGDGLLHNDNGTMKQTSAATLKTYMSDLTLTTAAQTNITSVGTLSALTVDNMAFNGNTLTTTSSDFIIDASHAIILDADGADITLKDGGTAFGVLRNSSTDFVVKSLTQDKDIIFQGNDGGSAITALTLDMSDAGTAVFGGYVKIADSQRVVFGDGSDLSIYHDGSNSYVNNQGTGDLLIRGNDVKIQDAASGHNMGVFIEDGGVELYHNNVKKLETQSDHIQITGHCYASGGRFGLDANDHIDVETTTIQFYINGGEEMRLEADGDLHVDGDVIAFSTTISDERLKHDIEPITDALDKVKQLNGVTFTYNADDKKSAGLIAQDVEKVLPSAVSEKELLLKENDGKKYKVLQYDQTIGLLVESIKELSTALQEATKRIETLENR